MPTVSEVLVQIKGDATELNESLDQAKEHVESFGAIAESVMQGFGLALGQMSFETVSHGLHHLIEEFIGVNSAAEVWTAQMTLLTGSTEKASARIEELAKWSHKAPFELTDIREANRLLQVFGGDALAGSKGMKLIGDAASFAQKPITEIAELVGRLHQALEAGSDDPRAIMTLRRMGVLSGEAAGQLTQLVRSHASATEIWAAFEKAISRTNGQMDVMMKTYRGQMTNLGDVTHELLHEVGKPFFDGAKDGLLKVLDWLNGAEGEKVKAQLIDFGRQFGELAKTAGPRLFKEATDGIVKFFDYISSDSGKKTISTVASLVGWMLKAATAAFLFGKIAAVFEPLVAVGTAVFGFVKTLAILGPTMETITVMFPALGAAIELLTGPVGWIIGAITALWFAWRNNWGHIHEYTADILAKIIHWYDEHADQFKKMGEFLALTWEFVVWCAQKAWGMIVDVVSTAWDILGPMLSGMIDTILGLFGMLTDLLTGNWSALWGDMEHIVDVAKDAILKVLGVLAENTLHIVSDIVGWIEHIPGVVGEAAKSASKYLQDQADLVRDYTKGIGESSDAAVTKDEKNTARRLLGLDSLTKAMGDLKKKQEESASLPAGNLALNPQGNGNGEGKGKGGKETDPNDEVKSKIEDLTKALALNGDASKLADLRYDLYRGTLKSANPVLKEAALALQAKAEKLESVQKANESLKERADELRKTIALGVEPTQAATLAYELMHTELAKASKAAKDHVTQLSAQAAALIASQTIWKKYHEVVDDAAAKMRGLLNVDDALGISLMGSAKAWDSLDNSQKKALVSVSRGAEIFQSLTQQADALKSKIDELRGINPAEAILGKSLASAEAWLATAPKATASQILFAGAVRSAIKSIRAQDDALRGLVEGKRAEGVAQAFKGAVAGIQSSIDGLKKGDTETIADRWAKFWDKQRGSIESFIKLRPTLGEFVGFIAKLKDMGGQEMTAQDDAGYLKNFTEEMKKVEAEQERVNGMFAEWVKTSHEASVAAAEFSNGLRQMTHAQAEQIVKAQDDIAKRAQQVEQIKKMGEKVADYIGGLVDNVVNGKIKGLFHEALLGFKQMLQQMAAEYLKSQITKGLMNLAAGIAGGGGGGVGGGGMFAGDASTGGQNPLGGLTPQTQAARAITSSRSATSYGTPAGGHGGPVSVVMNIHTPDVGGFRKSQRQILSDGMAHAATASRKAGK